MVVLIAEPDVERHEPDQLFHVLGIAGEGFSQPEQVFVVEGGVPVRGVQQPAGGMHMHLAAVLAVEAPDAEVGGPVPAGEKGGLRNLYPRPLRGEGTGVFHPADGGIVMARRELDQPRIAAGLGDGVGHDEPPVSGHPDHDLGPRPAGGAVQGHERAQRLHGQRVLIEGAPRLFGYAVQIDALGQRVGVRGHGLIFQRAHAAAPHQREPGQGRDPFQGQAAAPQEAVQQEQPPAVGQAVVEDAEQPVERPFRIGRHPGPQGKQEGREFNAGIEEALVVLEQDVSAALLQ